MQIPVPVSYSGQSSIFEAILEQCSLQDIAVEQPDPIEQLPLPSLFKQREETYKEHLFWMDEASYDHLYEGGQGNEDLSLQFKRVKSLREEQEIKITQFLREDKVKSLRCIEMENKCESPCGKYSQSLSPRKRKRSDKNRPLLKLASEFD